MNKTFNYRVLAFNFDQEIYFEVRRVYYIDGKETAFGSNTSLIGSTTSELRRMYKQLGEAFEKPVLWGGENFPQKYENVQQDI